jgi:sugar phosphate isomerase/epimerase
VHPRVAVSAISSFRQTLDADIELWARHGIGRVGVSVAKLDAHGWDDGLALVRAAGVDVANVIGLGPFTLDDPTMWADQTDRCNRAFATADTLGAGCLVLTTGRAGSLTWEDAADALERALRPALAEASRAGVHVALEHTNSLRTDVSFVHTLRDDVDLARRLGTAVCLEVNACWAERDLEHTIRDATSDGTLRLVQVSDYRIGTTRTPDRLVPGDGDIPLDRILASILAAGYEGDFDLELIGPAIEEEGYDSAIPRAVEYLSELLTRLGA